MVNDRQRDEHCPAPGGHVVNLKRRPGRQQNHFHWNCRKILPWKLPEQREIQFAESVRPRNAAQPHEIFARFAHEWQLRRVTSELQREVTFNRGVDFARAAEINVPATVRKLPFQNVTGAPFLQIHINLTQPMHEQHEVRAKCAIDQQLAAPVPIWPLLTEKILLRARDRARKLCVSRRIYFAPRRRASQCNYVSRRIHENTDLIPTTELLSIYEA